MHWGRPPLFKWVNTLSAAGKGGTPQPEIRDLILTSCAHVIYSAVIATRNGWQAVIVEIKSMLSTGTSGRGFSHTDL